MKKQQMTCIRPALLVAIGCLVSRAAIVPTLTFEQLVSQSEIIAHGRVTGSRTAWDNGHKYIWTHYSIAVIDPILGTPGSTLEISEPGGSRDGVHMQVSGAVTYGVGEEVVVLLYRTPIGYWRAIGSAQGKYTVRSDGLVTPGGVTVSEFESRVRDAIRRRK